MFLDGLAVLALVGGITIIIAGISLGFRLMPEHMEGEANWLMITGFLFAAASSFAVAWSLHHFHFLPR